MTMLETVVDGSIGGLAPYHLVGGEMTESWVADDLPRVIGLPMLGRSVVRVLERRCQAQPE
jgi:hypothetical protein